ncbi:MAG: hypothetical protein QXG35_03595 [Nitrososphaerota archaeon]
MPLSSILSESIIGIAAIIVAAALAGTFFSNMSQMTYVQKLQLKLIEEEAYHRCRIIHVAGEAGSSSLSIWVKNVGRAQINLELLDRSDLMVIGDNAHYLAYGGSWSYSLLNDVDSDGRWDPGETIRIDVTMDEPMRRGDYEAIIALYNGIECRRQFSL